MSEQAKILAQMQELIMEILKSGTASVEQGHRLDALEASLHKQKCFKKSSKEAYDCQGEEIAYLFFNNAYDEAIEKLYEYKIDSHDFFGFIEYHFDEDDDEDILAIFTDDFIDRVHKDYQSRCASK